MNNKTPYEELDNIEAILNIKLGTKFKDAYGYTYQIALDVSHKDILYHVVRNDNKVVLSITDTKHLHSFLIRMLRDNFLGHNYWEVVE